MTEKPEDWFLRLQSRLSASSAVDDLIKTPLETLQDCYEFLDAGWPPPHPAPTFAEVQRAYRSKLWSYNPDKIGLASEIVDYRILKTAKIKQAYEFVCQALGKDPEQGLEETEEILIAERDFLLEGWKDWWCGTSSIHISDEYSDRIEALRTRRKESLGLEGQEPN